MPRNNNEWFGDHGLTYTTGADAAAGSAPAAITVPSATRWQFKALWIQVVNDANVADRTLTVNLTDGTRTIWTTTFGTLTASQTGVMVLAAGNFTDDTTGTYQLVHIPAELVDDMPAAWSFNFTYTNVQAGDNFAATVTHHKKLTVL
jgi:hypothetical protein